MNLGRGTFRNVLLLASVLILPRSPIHAQQRAQKAPPTPNMRPRPRGEEVEEARLKAIFAAQDLTRKISLAERFLNDYPLNRNRDTVFDTLVTAYFERQDWPHFFATSDRALATYPDDVTILALAGWVIPHQFDPNTADASKRLDKAQRYEEHALELIPNMQASAEETADRLAAAKSAKLAQAHSGLGLVYFRKQNWESAVSQLEAATQTTTSADPADLYALGIGLEKLNRFADAADEFEKCSLAPSPLQATCKQSADKAKHQAIHPS